MMEEEYRVLGLDKYPPMRLPRIGAVVEPEWKFETPELSQRSKPESQEWLWVFVRKPLAGYAGDKPGPEEFCSWFLQEEPLDDHRRYVVNEATTELIRWRGVLGMFDLRRSAGASVRDMARTIRQSTRGWYQVLYVNRYAWFAHPTPLDELKRRVEQYAGHYAKGIWPAPNALNQLPPLEADSG